MVLIKLINYYKPNILIQFNCQCPPRFDLLLNMSANINDAKIAIAIPPAEAVNPPVNIPIIPSSFAAIIAPRARLAPKPIIGTVAPAFANSLNGAYILKTSNIIPMIKNKTKILAVVIFVLITKICAKKQINPPTKKDIT